jgi:hypothetical protein
MLVQHCATFTGSRIPEAHRLIGSATGDNLAIRRQRHAPYRSNVATQHVHNLTRPRVPEVDIAIRVPIGDQSPIRSQVYSTGLTWKRSFAYDARFIAQMPRRDRSVGAAARQKFAVPAQRQSADPLVMTREPLRVESVTRVPDVHRAIARPSGG